MGLTIHYHLQTPLSRTADVRSLVGTVRQVAHDLPFREVSEVLTFQGPAADFQRADPDDEHRWLKIQTAQYVPRSNPQFQVKPLEILGLSTWPGEGCEPANIGFCRYPAHLDVPTASGRRRRLATGLDGWCWSSFCKTQYSSDPKFGGVANFLRCHLCVVKLLDFLRSTGLVTVEVEDEGGYWQQRNLEKLAREVGDWNEMIAAFAGLFKDQAARDGMHLESAIAGFANFEHLEARGLDRLKELRRHQRPGS